MPNKQIKAEDQVNSKNAINENENAKLLRTTSSVTNAPLSRFTEAMKKYTYSLRTTASPLPAYLIRDQIPETPTSYYQYSDSRTGLPQVKSLPRLVQGYPSALYPQKVCMSNLLVGGDLSPQKANKF